MHPHQPVWTTKPWSVPTQILGWATVLWCHSAAFPVLTALQLYSCSSWCCWILLRDHTGCSPPMPFTQPCQNSQVSTHGLSMTLSFTVGLEGKTSCKNNCIQASEGVLSALSTHLAFVRFLKPLTKTDQATLLHWSQLAQIPLNVISIQFVSWRKKKEQFRGDLA